MSYPGTKRERRARSCFLRVALAGIPKVPGYEASREVSIGGYSEDRNSHAGQTVKETLHLNYKRVNKKAFNGSNELIWKLLHIRLSIFLK